MRAFFFFACVCVVPGILGWVWQVGGFGEGGGVGGGGKGGTSFHFYLPLRLSCLPVLSAAECAGMVCLSVSVCFSAAFSSPP